MDGHGTPVCGIMNESKHWLPFLMDYVEYSNSGSVEVLVIDSGRPPAKPGNYVFKWDGAYGAASAMWNETTGMPEYVSKLMKVAAWYCYSTRLDKETVIAVSIRGTGQQLQPNSTSWSDVWSCGRWAVANLGAMITHSVCGSRLCVASSLDEVQTVAVQLTELVCCRVPSSEGKDIGVGVLNSE